MGCLVIEIITHSKHDVVCLIIAANSFNCCKELFNLTICRKFVGLNFVNA